MVGLSGLHKVRATMDELSQTGCFQVNIVMSLYSLLQYEQVERARNGI